MNSKMNFSLDDFRNPPAIFSPGYFWTLNDTLDKDVLLEQLHDMYAHGARSVCIHPMPQEFRPTTMATNMSPAYLGKKYFEIVSDIVDECVRLEMNFYLYDEGAWPSGSAAGRVLGRNPVKYARRNVKFVDSWLVADESYRVPNDVLSVAVVDSGKVTKVFLSGEVIKQKDNDVQIRIFYVAKDFPATSGPAPLSDLLCKESNRKFIEYTHEGYKQYVGKEFGKCIKFAFTDEPAVHSTLLPHTRNMAALAWIPDWQLTWTDSMAKIFMRKKGYDILPFIPYFFEERITDNKTIKALLDFYDVWSALFVERFLAPLKDWCRENGLKSGGHLGGEDDLVYNAVGGYGSILRALRAMDLPGIDTIWRQIFPGNPELPVFPKYAKSVARQNSDNDLVLSESFMVYGSGLTPAEMKWITDQQLVLGVNVFVLGHYMYSTKEHFMAFARPFFGKSNPFWKYMEKYHKYTERMCYLLSRGTGLCSTAVYLPVRDIWAGGDFYKNAIDIHNKIAASLLQNHCDYDYIDDDVMVHENLSGSSLKLGDSSYSTIIMPNVKWISATSLKFLATFVKDGGTVIAVNTLPEADGGELKMVDLVEEKPFNAGMQNIGKGKIIISQIESICNNIENLVEIIPRNPNIRVYKRNCSNCTVYFFTNTVGQAFESDIIFRKNAYPLLCDAERATFSWIGETAKKSDRVSLKFAPWESKTIIFTEEPDSFSPEGVYTTNNLSELMDLNSGWRLNPLKEYAIGEEDYEIMEINGKCNAPVDLCDWRKYLGNDFSGDAEYAIDFIFQENPDNRRLFIELGKVNYAASVKLNEKELGQLVWGPFRVDISDCIRKGENNLKIIVTNSLANSILADGLREKWCGNCGKSWPDIKFVYDDMQRNFEKDSLPSGLFGPVKIYEEITRN
jgi:hypothetical protein